MDTTVVFAADIPAATISDRVRRGQLVRLATGIYTSDVTSDPAVVVRREWHTIFGTMFPRAVITDRSAVTGGPGDGLLYLAHEGRGREAELPGVTVLARPGAGPLRTAADISELRRMLDGLESAESPAAVQEPVARGTGTGHPRFDLAQELPPGGRGQPGNHDGP
jgi:hypothetical protein